MNNPLIKLYLLDSVGLYYHADILPDGSYNVNLSSSVLPILTMPDGWSDIDIKWDRDTTFLGVFTTQSQNLKFVSDARAIMLYLFYGIDGIIQAECRLRVDIFIDVNIGYQTAYECEIDFSKAEDEKFNGNASGLGNAYPELNGEFIVPTLNGRLNELLSAYGDSQMNLPMWVTSDAGLTWDTNDAVFALHKGIKLLYSANYNSSASVTNFLKFNNPDLLASDSFILGFNLGNHGSIPNDGYHTILSLSPFNIVQNNGTTTFIGNDILQPFLIQSSQFPGVGDAGETVNELNFDGGNNSRPYTRNNNSLKNLLKGIINVNIKIHGKFEGTVLVSSTGTHQYIGFAIFEISSNDRAPIISGKWQYLSCAKYPLPNTGGVYTPPFDGVFDFDLNNVVLSYDKCYIFAIIADNDAGTTERFGMQFSDLNFSILSNYDSGLSGIPIDAPRFPDSPIMGMLPKRILEKLVPLLNSEETDQYGFNIVPAGTPYTGVSDFLSNDVMHYDNSPMRTLIFSANTLQLLPGYPYISISLNDFFKMCFNTWGCGLGIEDRTKIRLEKLSYFFQDIEIMNLDNFGGVSKMKVRPLTQIMSCYLQAGYSENPINSDFGADVFNHSINFNTPLTKVPGSTLNVVNSIVADMYAMEKRRVQQNTSSVGTSALSGGVGQSSGNENYIIEIENSGTLYVREIPDPMFINIETTPGNLHTESMYGVRQFSGAQSNDPAATFGEYIYGLFYPDTALNLGITPKRNLLRLGGYLKSMLDSQTGNIIYREIYQMLYNNISELVPGIKTNLFTGGGGIVINECSDISITSQLGDEPQLFRPFEISIETVSPVNCWQIMTGNINGYISWTWKGVQFKMFISHIDQNLALSRPTSFIGWCHPSITNSQLIKS